MPPSPSAAGLLYFLNTIQSLKITKRTGWVNHNVPNPESIADHMHRMSVMALVVGDTGLNRDKCVKMALVHDIGEAIVGDITPHDGVSDTDKHACELAAYQHFRTLLGDTPEAKEMHDLWLEYDAGETAEAKLVKDLDKLEMIVQALEYERAYCISLEQFLTSTRAKFRHPTVREWAEELDRERTRFWAESKPQDVSSSS
ncbi:hypothetical protein M427DRAFT_124620 [Gonapodya prolifera JEL478]|uniref:5'-deoxynucleotidase n=1 Tax=Gonapodya prolifera (strain JEL478) TaxID=1344416 RepID=A0A139AB08_GONPJ|nr:hypothetical protein M427DRAFT_124620 [Gonapodya prolifera JEL478]|eukprot:KXS13854.1 hypothetical protein M427DRAFT_124620 [Gonapodya prolifera JEL478]